MSSVSADVAIIKESLKEAPLMKNIGKELDSLKSSLAAYEATIMELKNSYAELKPPQFIDISKTISNMNSSFQATLDSVFENIQHQHASFSFVYITFHHKNVLCSIAGYSSHFEE